jgi:hypothetical protein
MKLAHACRILAAGLVAASLGAFADAGIKVSPLDSVQRGAAASDPVSPATSRVHLQGARDLSQPAPLPAEFAGGPAPFVEAVPHLATMPKSVANGLYMSGAWNASWVGSTVSLTLDQINNDSFSRTSGTLRLELWAVSSPPARGAGFTGYRLANFTTLNPLAPRTFYSSVTRSGTMSYPPDGTYWIVLVLSEFDSVNCSQSDRFCVQDSLVSNSTSLFGAAPPPIIPSGSGIQTKSLGARGSVSPSTTMFGGFEVSASARVYILVRGNSLGSLGVTQAYMDAPRVRLYNQAGADLVSQGGLPGFNFCSASASTDAPVVQYYAGRGQPVNSRDTCYATVLGAGAYTFSVTPSNSSTSASATSSTFSGEVLFEVTLLNP